MNFAALITVLALLLLATLLSRVALQSRVRRIPPRRRYAIFAVLFATGISAEILAVIISAFRHQTAETLVMITAALLFGAACVLEMRKLNKEI